MSMLTRTVLAPLKPGKYTATLSAFSEHPNEKDPTKSYVRLDLQLPDRITNDNRFDKGFDIALQQLRQQLTPDLEEPLSAVELLTLAQQTEFDVWMSVVEVDGKHYRNFSYREPLSPIDATDQDTDDDANL